MRALGNSRALIIFVAVIAGFVIGIISANPVVEAAQGWKAAFDDLQQQINNIPQGPVSLDVIEVTDLVQGFGPGAAASATCPQDRVLVGGSGSYDSGGQVVSFRSLPDESIPNTFNATVITGGLNDFNRAIAVALCAKLIP